MPLPVCNYVYLVAKLHNVHFVKNLFIDVANVVSMGQNAYAPITLKNHVSMLFRKNMCNFRCRT